MKKTHGSAAVAAIYIVVAALAVSAWTVRANEAAQVNEAIAVFDGRAAANMRGGTWKVVYSSAEGPEGRAIEVLTERLGAYLLREGHLSTTFVLPLEKDGGEPVKTKRDMIVIGLPSENATLKALLGNTSVPKGGYAIKTFNAKGRNIVLLAGDTPSAVLWAAFDFLDVVAPDLECSLVNHAGRYAGTFFRAKAIPAYQCVREPETPIRSVFSWGHVIDDYRATFRSMARARFNRAILWNDQYVVNAREVVETAHSWGIQVYWGCSWGWTLSGKNPKDFSLQKVADEIVDEWRNKWRHMGGDGIYLQSFTETSNATIGGRPIPEAATELVNEVARRIRAEAPGTDIVFGLHSNSMKRKGAAEAIAKVDPSIEILWENCGGFPFWECDLNGGGRADVALCDRALANNNLVGFAWKAQLRIDWGDFVSSAGPFMLGCAGRNLLDRDVENAAYRHLSLDEDWVVNGKTAWEHVRALRSGDGAKPVDFSAVAEYNPAVQFRYIVPDGAFMEREGAVGRDFEARPHENAPGMVAVADCISIPASRLATPFGGDGVVYAFTIRRGHVQNSIF